jgi:hypothetical protein
LRPAGGGGKAQELEKHGATKGDVADMRHLKLTLGVAVSVCAFALAATPALAGEFVASNTGKVAGAEENLQEFKFGSVKMKCFHVKANGEVAAGSSTTYTAAIKFTKCLTGAKIGRHEIFLATHWLTPLTVTYHNNGFVETGATAEVKINMAKTEEFEKSECHIKLAPQTIPVRAIKNPEETFEEASYTNTSRSHNVSKNFPTGIQNGIVIHNEFRGIHFEYEGEPCEEWGREEGPEGNAGQFTGSFPQFLSTGNFEFL